MLQGEHVGEQVWQGAVGVAHRCHKEGHHPAGEDGDKRDAGVLIMRA